MVAPAGLLALHIVVSSTGKHGQKQSQFLGNAETNAKQLIAQGRKIFRFDTYGDEAFWSDQLHMEQAVSGLTPRDALALGLKVDAGAISPSVVQAIKHGRVNLDDPAVTLDLVKQNAVLGVVGTFEGNTLTKVGFTVRSAIRPSTTPSHRESASASMDSRTET